QHLIQNVAVSNFDNSGIIQNVWSAGELRQAFASDGGLAFGGDFQTDAPIITGDGNIVATDTAQASGRDTIQNQGDGNLALGGDQTIAQDTGVIAGGDALAQGDKVGGNNNEAENTGNQSSISFGGNNNAAENTGNDNSVSIGGNNNAAENTGNTLSVGDVAVDLSDRSDNSVSVGGNQNNAENTGNTVGDVAVDLSDRSDNSVTIGGNNNAAENTGNTSSIGGNNNAAENTGNTLNIGDIAVDSSETIGGDYWENGSNTGGIGNIDNRNQGNTTDSGNTVAITENHDMSTNFGSIALDLSDHSDNSDHSNSSDNSTNTVIDDHSVTTGDTFTDSSTTSGDLAIDLSDHSDNSNSSTNTVIDDHSVTSGDTVIDASTETTGYVYDDHTYNAGDTYTDASSSYGNYYEEGSGNSNVTETTVAPVTTDYSYTFGA
ncbi:beta strand repeat-containing protein, partial [Leucobacter albus]